MSLSVFQKAIFKGLAPRTARRLAAKSRAALDGQDMSAYFQGVRDSEYSGLIEPSSPDVVVALIDNPEVANENEQGPYAA